MPKFEKQGVITSENLGCQLYSEPDGSKWIHIVHHNNPSEYKFASTDDFTKNLYKDSNRWFKAYLCNLITDNHYEFLIIQKANINNAAVNKYRWIQSVNPYNAVFEDVDYADVTHISTSGYSVPASYGGIYKFNSNTFFTGNNSTKGNWWGAIGAWSAHQGGIPGWGGIVVTTGFLDLFLRADGFINDSNTHKLSIFQNEISAIDYFEL